MSISGAKSLDALQSEFSIPSVLRWERGAGGLIRAVITTSTAQAHVYLHGAHVTHYQTNGYKPLLFLSDSSSFQQGKPIRGGVPICFPWFGPKAGDPAAPAHGFARVKEWAVESAARADDGSVRLALSLASDESTRATWPYDFRVVYTITIGAQLRLSLDVRNTGSHAFIFEEALHTYLSVSDVHKVHVQGLEGTQYIDKVQGGKRMPQGAQAVTFNGETDRIYLDTLATCVVRDRSGDRNISIAKDGSDTTVVWNPWINKAKAMADFGDDEWPRMLCVETCNVADSAITLEAGKSRTMTAVIDVVRP